MPRPSLSGENLVERAGFQISGVAGVDAPAFVERALAPGELAGWGECRRG